MTTKTVTKGTLFAETAITFVVVVLSYAMLQTVMGMYWESEWLGWKLALVSLYAGGIYLLYFFWCTRRHMVLTVLITLGIVVGITLIMASVNASLHSAIISFRWSTAFLIRALYFIGIMEVADHFGKPIRNKKEMSICVRRWKSRGKSLKTKTESLCAERHIY
ncbi:MAG: hypothetical protein HFJ47_03175 [Clostridia bacterium]|nr:hypothetical protein [Clostridia bacterium]